MKGFLSMFVKSARELKSVKCITITGVFIAVSMLIETYSIDLQFVKINFAFLAIAVIGMLFGPIVGLFSGFACDIVGFLVHPSGGFLPAYVIVGGIQGLIYGLCLYQKNDGHSIVVNRKSDGKQIDITLYLRAVAARLLDVIVINLLIQTKLNMYYGFIPKQAYSEAIVARTAKNVIELAVDLPMLFVLLPMMLMVYRRITVSGRAHA